jgi:hypothetical protein
MNDKQTNHIGTVKACIRVANLQENRAVWDGNPPLAFEADLATLTTDCATAEGIAARANSAAKGYADAKEEAEDKLEKACFKTARALASHFKKSGDLGRLAKVDYKIGYYQKLRDQHLITAATDLVTIGTAASSEPGATDRGVTPALIAQLQTALTAFTGVDAAPRTGIVSRSALKTELEAKVAELMEQLEDLDDLVIQFDETPAGLAFIAAWRKARIIVDAGHGPANDDPTPPPAPTA